MDPILGPIMQSKSEKQISRLRISTPTQHSSTSNTTTQDITHTPAGDIPPPHFINSITELRTFSTALSEFLSRYDELHNHCKIIKSSIDSKLPNQIVDATNPNQSALPLCLETANGCPGVTVSDQNPKPGVSDFEGNRESERTSDIGFSQIFKEVDDLKKFEVVDALNNYEEIDVGKIAVKTNTSKKRKFADVSDDIEEIDVSKSPVEINSSKKPEVVDHSKNPVEIDTFKKPVDIDVSKNIEEIVVSKNIEEIVVSKKHAESDTSNKPEETVSVEIELWKNTEEIAVLSKKHAESDTFNKPEETVPVEIDVSKNIEGIVVSKKHLESDASKEPEETVPVEIDVLKNIEDLIVSKKLAESDNCKKPGETVPETSCDQVITAPDTIVPEQSLNGIGANNCEQIYENVPMPKNIEEIDVPEKSEQTDILNKPDEIDTLKKNEQTDICKNTEKIDVLHNPEEINASVNHEDIDALHKPEEFDSSMDWEEINTVMDTEDDHTSKNGEEIDTVMKKPEQADACMKPEETGTLMKHEETGALKKHEEVGTMKKQEEIGTMKKHEEIGTMKKQEETGALKKQEEIGTMKKQEEIGTMKKQEEIGTMKKQEEIGTIKKQEEIGIMKKHEEIVTLKKHTGICWKAKEIDVSRKHEETGTMKKHMAIRKKAKEIDVSRKHEETKPSKNIVSVLESLCQSLEAKGLKRHVASHYPQMKLLQKEIAMALKRVKNPANLVLNSIGRFFMQGRRSFCKVSGLNVARLASVLILECFVMISDDIKTVKEDQERAAEAAFDWGKRMIKEGGLRHADEVDARGLLFLIAGFRIVYKIRDIADLIIASNVKGISAALGCSVFLIKKIPEVVNLMVKDNMEIEAADLAFTFRLEDKCDPQKILSKYLYKKIKDIQNITSFQMSKEKLSELKSVKQSLESLRVDPSILPDLDKEIHKLDQEINQGKRKSSERTPLIRHESKRARFSHENMRYHQEFVDHYGINRSPQPRTRSSDFVRNRSNNYFSDYSPSPDRLASSYLGSYDLMVHPVNVQPYGGHEPYGQRYTRYSQTHDSQPYGRPRGWGTPESSPVFRDIPASSGFPGRQGRSSDLYGFADIVEKEFRGFRSSGSYGA